MARWQSGSADRLRQSALELYLEQGFDRTTVAEIADRAGLTERTFFRYFADKREVLFDGQDTLVTVVVAAVDAAESDRDVDLIGAVLSATALLFTAERREFARERQAVIEANPELQERELLKLERLGAQVAAALRRRGLDDDGARLAASVAVTVFRDGFTRWIADGEDRDLLTTQRVAFERIREWGRHPLPD